MEKKETQNSHHQNDKIHLLLGYLKGIDPSVARRTMDFNSGGFSDQPDPDPFNDQPPPDTFNDQPPPDTFNDQPPPDTFNDQPPPDTFNDQPDPDPFTDQPPLGG
jgi:hypothetical protein